jgi:hypothetical protein
LKKFISLWTNFITDVRMSYFNLFEKGDKFYDDVIDVTKSCSTLNNEIRFIQAFSYLRHTSKTS